MEDNEVEKSENHIQETQESPFIDTLDAQYEQEESSNSLDKAYVQEEDQDTPDFEVIEAEPQEEVPLTQAVSYSYQQDTHSAPREKRELNMFEKFFAENLLAKV